MGNPLHTRAVGRLALTEMRSKASVGHTPLGGHRSSVARGELLAVIAIALVSSAAGCGGGSTRSDGSPSAGGSAGSAGAFGDPTPRFTPLEAARACVLIAACLRDAPKRTVSRCVHDVERTQVAVANTPPAFAKCAAHAATCTEAFDCATLGHGPDYCSAHVEPSCDGDLVVSCPGGPDWAYDVFDCASAGMKCVNGHCTDGNSCTGPIVLNCNGNRVTACELFSGIQASTDCATVYPGGRCGLFTPGGLQCLPPEKETCASVGSSQCSGNLLLGCDGPRKSKLDCGALDSDCANLSSNADCVPRAHDCSYESPDQCHGAALSVCIDGRYQDIDCGSLGLGPCQTTPTGVACGSSLTP